MHSPAPVSPPAIHQDWLARYQLWRKWVEPGFWIVTLCAQAAVNSVVVQLDIERVHLKFAPWEPVVWEWTSHLLILALVPAVITFERRFPLQFGSLKRNLWPHLAASLAFCLAHVVGMVALRKLAYLGFDSNYVFGSWGRELGYEYLKDIRTYAGILLITGAYRLLLLRAQGEASLLAAPDDGPPVEPIERPERFLVRKLGREFLLPAADVEWLQAMGNYVNLRVRAHDYPLRATMAAIESRLDPARFVRVHRSYIVNLDCVLEIEPIESGDARIKMRDGSQIPCSRRYRDELRKKGMG
ncbi:MAG TPA: LytTR family DNA-binding domain-containing protein [Usitatibacteraceae bacterium]